MRGRGLRRVLALLVPAVLCATATPAVAGKGAIDSPPKPKQTFDSVLNARRRADGSLPKKAVLAAFETAIAPLPGVKVKALPRRGLFSGTEAVEGITLEVWNELTPAQQRAVDKLLRAQIADAREAAPATGPAGGSAARRGISEVEIGRRIDEYRGEIASRLGRDLPYAPRFTIGELPEEAPDTVLAMSYSLDPDDSPRYEDEPDGPPAGCMIAVRGDVAGSAGDAELTTILAHEVFHCFQRTYGGLPLSASVARGAWINEGQAAWVGETIAGGSSESREWWQAWLSDTLTGLFFRSYDAIGFYADLEANGIDPWSVFDPMLAVTGGGREAFNVAVGGRGPDFLDVIAKALVRQRPLGAAWESEGPGITDHSGTVDIEVTPESTDRFGDTRTDGACGPGCAGRPTIEHHVQLDAYGTQPYLMHLDGDLAQVVTSASRGVMGFESGTQITLEPGRVETLCLLPGGCVCEDGSAPFSGVPLVNAQPGEVGLAIAAEHRGRYSVNAAAVTLDQACAADTGMDECLLGRWVLDVPRLQDAVQARFLDAGAVITASGGGDLTFGASSYDANLDVRLSASNEVSSVGTVKAEVAITGSGNTKYRSNGFTVVPSEPETTFVAAVRITVGGREVATAPVDLGVEGLGDDLFGDIFYTCPTEDRLVMTPPEGYPVEFTRER